MDAFARVAPASTYLVIPALLLAAITIALFFYGPGEPFGSLNDFFTAMALLLLVPAVVAVHGRVADGAGAWLSLLSGLAVVGLLVAAIGQLLLIARLIGLSTSFVTGGVGIVPVLAWLMALTWLSLGPHLLPDVVGWTGVAVLASAALLTTFASLKIDAATWATSAALIVSLVAWLLALGAFVQGRGPGTS